MEENIIDPTPLEQGWAQREKRSSRRFNDNQRGYLDEQFEIGVRDSHRKVNPKNLAKQVQEAKDANGRTRFHPSEYLTKNQIRSYFSTKARKCRKNQVSTAAASTEECLAADGQDEDAENVEGNPDLQGETDPWFETERDALMTEISGAGLVTEGVQPPQADIDDEDEHDELFLF